MKKKGEKDMKCRNKRSGRKTGLWIVCAWLCLLGATAQAVAENIPTPREVASWLGLGWNLGNLFDAHQNGVASETAWGNPPVTKKLLQKVAEAGFTSVRIPVTWLGHMGKAPDYAVDPLWLDRIAEVVDDAESLGLRVILNIHHDGADSQYWLDVKTAATDAQTHAAVKKQLAALWTQIALRFKDKGEFLIFESMNEIHDGGWGWGNNRTDGGRQYDVVNEWNQVFVDAVRGTGGKNATRYLGVPGYCANPELTMKHFVMPDDKTAGRLLVAVHFYDPTPYTLEARYPAWGHTAPDSLRVDWGGETHVTHVFGQLKDKFIDRGIPVYIGEMGCVRRGDEKGEAFRRYYLEYVCKAAHACGMAPFYWDNGSNATGRECSGLFDRKTGEFSDGSPEAVACMKRAVFSQEDSYTLESIYQHAP